MRYTKPSQNLTTAPSTDNMPAGDQARAFTERPRTDSAKNNDSEMAHDLFNLFTANIIKAKTEFFR